MARLALVSFRLGGVDGVSVECAKWTAALRTLGHEVVLVAGEGHANVLVEGLAIGAPRAPRRDELERALDGAELVIVENVASLPLNVRAREVLYRVLEGRRALFHHHDLAWQRASLAHLAGPRDGADWTHVTINELSRRQLAERGIAAQTLRNSFDCDPPAGQRAATRRALGLSDEILVLQPTRAIARKNIEGSLALSAALGAVLWLLGPVEEGYDDEFRRLVHESNVSMRRGLPAGRTIHDAYAAADVVVMASTWEGFGNPVLESVTHRRPLALHPYPVAREITDFGFTFFALDDERALREFLRAPDESLLERNRAIARQHFNLADLPRRLDELLQSAGVQTAGSL